MNGLAGCYVSTIGKPREYFDLTGIFSAAARPGQRLHPYLAHTWHSKIEIRDECRK